MNNKKDSLFIWGGNWSIENDKAWFVPGECNAIFQIDMNTNQCSFIAELPNNTANTYTFNFYCIKCDNDIFCMPYRESDSIWVYQIDNSQFCQIKVAGSDDVQNSLYISEFWQYGKKIFAVSRSLKQILEINIREKKIENYYAICDMSTDEIANSIKVGKAIYSVSVLTNKIFQFDIETKKNKTYIIPDVEECLYAVDFDGKNFWLTGFSKKIYVWNKEDNTVITIDKFPDQFGIYNFGNDGKDLLDCKLVKYNSPVFINIIAIGGYIWCIPLQTNKIIYIDKETKEVNTFEIEDENETKCSLAAKRIQAKYALQYVKENRYIGLFSYKNNCVIEIDTLERTVQRKKYLFDKFFLKSMEHMYESYGMIFREHRDIDRLLFGLGMSDKNREQEKELSNNTGEKIHRELMLWNT